MRKVQRHTTEIVRVLKIQIVPNMLTEVEVRYKRIRGLTLRVTNDTFEKKRVILTANKILSEKETYEVLDKYKDFLHKCFDKTTIHKSSLNENEYMLFGKVYEVVIQKNIDTKIIDNTILTSSINKIDLYAFEEITKLYNETVSKYNFPKATLSFRKMKSRWGVCNISKKTITLTKALIHVPLECVYQVICHELTHLYVGNHSPMFHNQLQKICPNERLLNKRLREYSEFLYD